MDTIQYLLLCRNRLFVIVRVAEHSLYLGNFPLIGQLWRMYTHNCLECVKNTPYVNKTLNYKGTNINILCGESDTQYWNPITGDGEGVIKSCEEEGYSAALLQRIVYSLLIDIDKWRIEVGLYYFTRLCNDSASFPGPHLETGSLYWHCHRTVESDILSLASAQYNSDKYHYLL